MSLSPACSFFFFNDTAPTEIYTLSLHDASSDLISTRRSPGSSGAAAISPAHGPGSAATTDRKSTRLNSSHRCISYAVFFLDRKSTRLNSSHRCISYAVFFLDRKSTRLNSSHRCISYAVYYLDRKSTRLNSSHRCISYAVFCLKKKKQHKDIKCLQGIGRLATLYLRPGEL